ncbi:hypothetical protein VPHD479_0144 [Vibrio phage D479]
MFESYQAAATYCDLLEDACDGCCARPKESPMGDSWFATYSLGKGLITLPRDIKQNFEKAVRVE